MKALQISPQEQTKKAYVLNKIIEFIQNNITIKLPEYDPKTSKPSEQFALTSIGIEPNPFGSTLDEYRYQFEGEEDLLHLIIVRIDGNPIEVEQAQQVVQFILEGIPPALIMMKPGEYSQHFFLSHDVLLDHLRFKP